MKFFINVKDKRVAIDGKEAANVSMDALPSEVVTVGWYGSYGDEHFLESGAVKVRRVFDLAPYSSTIAEAEAIIAAVAQLANQAPTYADLRATAYPDYRDYLDGLVKGDQAQIDAYIAACNAVKLQYPKP
jgi:hypothetical protein